MSPRKQVPVAQLDRASDYESEGWEFESLRARHFPQALSVLTINEKILTLMRNFSLSVRMVCF